MLQWDMMRNVLLASGARDSHRACNTRDIRRVDMLRDVLLADNASAILWTDDASALGCAFNTTGVLWPEDASRNRIVTGLDRWWAGGASAWLRTVLAHVCFDLYGACGGRQKGR
jgi:hypothetical protein